MAQYKGAASEAGRAMQLVKKRERQLEEIELRKKKIEEDLKLSSIENKFAAHYDAVEQQLKSSTIGLVTLDEMKAKQEIIVKAREMQLALKQQEKELEILKEIEAKKAEKRRQKQAIQTLSFDPEDDEGEEDNDDDDAPTASKLLKCNSEEKTVEPHPVKSESSDDSNEFESSSKMIPIIKKKIGKNPDVDTSFLPDREREEAENQLREKLRQEWVAKQEAMKNEEIEITYSYWDGSGHRRTARMKKGNSIYQFLQRSLESLRKEFGELKSVTGDQLMYVKEDLIIPHHYTFYDFIVTKARGKSGPLFSFDVKDDIRMVNDATVEKEDSHAGKVLLRSWYERNKHIFPASRWEPYDPTKTYSKYTVHDKNTK